MFFFTQHTCKIQNLRKKLQKQKLEPTSKRSKEAEQKTWPKRKRTKSEQMDDRFQEEGTWARNREWRLTEWKLGTLDFCLKLVCVVKGCDISMGTNTAVNKLRLAMWGNGIDFQTRRRVVMSMRGKVYASISTSQVDGHFKLKKNLMLFLETYCWLLRDWVGV